MSDQPLLAAGRTGDGALFAEIVRLDEAGSPSVLATVIGSQGSSPRKAGAKMLIRADGSTVGSVGGGTVELEVIAAAQSVLREGAPRTQSFTLNEQNGHVCGGVMQIYLEPNTIAPRLVIVGAGHIGGALAALAAFTGFHVTVIDERSDYACAQRLPAADAIVCAPAGEALAELARVNVGPATAIVIATPGYVQDFAAVRAALKTRAAHIGVIGSRRKRAALAATLAREGYADEAMARVHLPIGLAIGAQTPREIAVSIVAQLIAWNQGA